VKVLKHKPYWTSYFVMQRSPEMGAGLGSCTTRNKGERRAMPDVLEFIEHWGIPNALITPPESGLC
jgi:hypothetical protein